MNQIIEVNGLSKQYDSFFLDHISFSVPGGCVMGLIGENGAGKTTIIKSILGLIRTDCGTVRILGRDPETDRAEIGRSLGVVLDGSFFYSSLRICDISRIMAGIHPGWDPAFFAENCRRFSLPEKKPLSQLSKGMLAKVKILAALSHHPRLLILDEPTSGLDPVVRSEILELFWDFVCDEQHSILLSSHITSDLEKIADYITFVHNGKLVFTKPMDTMQEEYGVLKCRRSDAACFPDAEIIARRDSAFDAELLIANRAHLAGRYPDAALEPASLDDIMTFYAKGVPAE